MKEEQLQTYDDFLWWHRQKETRKELRKIFKGKIWTVKRNEIFNAVTFKIGPYEFGVEETYCLQFPFSQEEAFEKLSDFMTNVEALLESEEEEMIITGKTYVLWAKIPKEGWRAIAKASSDEPLLFVLWNSLFCNSN